MPPCNAHFVLCHIWYSQLGDTVTCSGFICSAKRPRRWICLRLSQGISWRPRKIHQHLTNPSNQKKQNGMKTYVRWTKAVKGEKWDHTSMVRSCCWKCWCRAAPGSWEEIMAWNISCLFLLAWAQRVVFAVKRSHPILIRTGGKAWEHCSLTGNLPRFPMSLLNECSFSRDIFVPKAPASQQSSLWLGNVPAGAPAGAGMSTLTAILLHKFPVHTNVISCAKKVGNFLKKKAGNFLNSVKDAGLVPSDYFVRLEMKWSSFFKAE